MAKTNKFYAVREGQNPGIYRTWDECQKNIKGYKGAKYKSFKTEEEAKCFMNETESAKNETNTATMNQEIKDLINNIDDATTVAFVDGSFNKKTSTYGCGIVLISKTNGQINQSEFMKSGDNPKFADSRNVTGELQGIMLAISKAKQFGKKEIIVFYDYTGIELWTTGEWEAKTPVAKAYTEWFNNNTDTIKVTFKKVAAHTGVTYNERADKLAKEAVGVK